MQTVESSVLSIVTFLIIKVVCLYTAPIKVNAQEIGARPEINFIYSNIKGIGIDSIYNRRDPSDVIKVKDKYYVWYTRMNSPVRSGYWGTIWYATSEDAGYTWTERGMALGLGKHGNFDSHSVFTPNILAYDGKYYLYYTGVQPTPGNSDDEFENNSINDFTAIGIAIANTPDGPFKRLAEDPVLNVSVDSTKFDSYRIDDASLLVKDNKIWLYYKGRSIIHGFEGPNKTKMGVAFAETPKGPYVKHESPIMDHSHEVLIWQQNEGVASLASLSSAIEFASDGLNFIPVQKNLQYIPKAPGLYRPDLQNGNANTNEIPTWGISMSSTGEICLERFEMNICKQ